MTPETIRHVDFVYVVSSRVCSESFFSQVSLHLFFFQLLKKQNSPIIPNWNPQTKSQPVNELSIEKKKLIKTILKFIVIFSYLFEKCILVLATLLAESLRLI